MRLKSLIIPLLNLAVFVGAGVLLLKLGSKPLADKPAPEADDVPLTMHTDVAVQLGSIEKTTLRRKIIAYGQVGPDAVARLDVPSADAALLRIDAEASLRPTTRSAAMPSRVTYVGRMVDTRNGTVAVDVVVGRPAEYVPGQWVAGEIIVEKLANCLAVPAKSIVRDETGWPCIGLVSPDHRSAQLRKVIVGMRDGDMVQVQGDDLQPGQTIVTTGAAALVNRTGIHVMEP